MSALTPTLCDISISNRFFLDPDVLALQNNDLAVLLRLVGVAAASLAWTFTPPAERPQIKTTSPDRLARIADVSKGQWPKRWATIEHFFIEQEGSLVLERDWIEVKVGYKRPAIDAGTRSAVLQRDGWRCLYCGTTTGPFDIDHVIPLSQGGDNSLDNLCCSCASCNRSKGARTVREWIHAGQMK